MSAGATPRAGAVLSGAAAPSAGAAVVSRRSPRHLGAALLALLGSPLCPLPALGAPPAVVVARAPGEAPDPALQAVAAELAQRCPARQVPFAPLSPRLPRLTREAAEPPLPEDLADASAAFFKSEDPLAAAVSLRRAARELAQEPAALLARPERRLRLQEAYLFAARGLLQAGREGEARALLGEVAIRLPDLPAPEAARWGPALAAAAAEARRALPPPSLPVLIEGPGGWAVHIDEQPLGPLPRQRALLRPGPHAVVAVGPDGSRASWLLQTDGPAGPASLAAAVGPEAPAAPGASTPLRLVADPRLEEVCATGDQVALCAAGDAPPGAQALGALLGGDVLVLRRRGDLFLGWRVEPGGGRALPAASSGEAAPMALARALCPPSSLAQAPARPGAEVAPRRWPGVLLASAGAALALGSLPLFLYQGRCVEEDCARVYDFRGLPAGLAGAGAALAVGGALWLALALRR